MRAAMNHRVISTLAAFVSCFVLVSCGGGGGRIPGGMNPQQAIPAPSGLSYPTPQVLAINHSVTPINPTITAGSVTSYSVSPALPVGLTLNTTSGAITGTPTAITAQATYTVTATNSAGSTTAPIVVAVNDAAPAISYSGGRVALAVGLPIATLTPSATGGAVVTWSISPALPSGLAFGTTDGTISGTPTVAATASVYTVTATNSGGQSSFPLTLSVETGTVLDVGHGNGIELMRFDGTHALSLDIDGHWVLWGYAGATNIANGDTGCGPPQNACGFDSRADMAGSSFALQTPTGFEMHSSTDGHLLGTIQAPLSSSSFTWWKLASDGSYLTAGGSQGLEAWSPAGQVLFSKPGNYVGGVAFAAPGQISLTGGPSGVHAIETVDVTTGNSTVSSNFNGTFLTWFADGQRFVTVASGTALTYSNAAVQQDATLLTSVGSLGGSGNWLWNNRGGTLDIYQVGASTTPKASFAVSSPRVIPSGSTLGLLANSQLSVVDLSGATPVKADQTLPIGEVGAVTPGGYAATDAGHWLVGNAFGVVLDGAGLPATPRFLDYGSVMSVAGSASRFAVSTASGRIIYFDSTTRALQDTIQKFSAKLQLSADGTVLAAQGDKQGAGTSTDNDLDIYSLPSKTVSKTWAYPSGLGGGPSDIILSGSGTVLGQVGANGNGHEVTSVDGSTVIWTDQQLNGPICLAPSNNLIAINDGDSVGAGGLGIGAVAVINTGVLSTAFNGFAVGWLDDQRLLLNNYQIQNRVGSVFVGATIVSPTGTKLADSPLPEIKRLQLLGADSIYSPELNEIVSPTSGAVSWTTGDSTRQLGAVAGSYVVFVSGARVLALSQ